MPVYYIRNLTPHPLSLQCADGSSPLLSIPPYGIVPRRIASVRVGQPVTDRDGNILSVSLESLGPVTGLPAPETGVILVVSRLVASAVSDREDVYAPGEVLRAPDGRIIGARGLCRVFEAR